MTNQYIYLTEGIIQKGDQYFDEELQEWKDSMMIGHRINWTYTTTKNKYRRPI